MRRYGQIDPPLLNFADVKKSGIPMTLVGAKHDLILNIEAPRRVRDLLADYDAEYFEINGGHQVYFVGNQLDEFFYRIMSGMQKHNPV